VIPNHLFKIKRLSAPNVRFLDNEKCELEQQPVDARGMQRDGARTSRNLSASSAATMHHAFTRAMDKRKLQA